MSLPPQFLDELRARVALSDLIGKRLRLVRSNREWKGLCPFHNEKTPSFTVNDQKGFFHCFGCGAHGDAIGFLMQHDRLGFMEAVEQLAGQVGLEVPQATPEDRRRYEKRKSLYDLTEAAGRFFESQLAAPAGRAARDYFAQRGLDGETISRFRLGYAPADAQALLAHLKAEGFEEADILEVGLARRPDDGRAPYAFFRNRVIFPVADSRGRVVAFGARLLEGEGPKYVNSPDGPLFHKGRLLYGLSRARQAAGQGHAVVVAEGYMDVIALVRAGFEAAVAPLGTALTEAQAQELWKIAREPVLCFDGDGAGKRAAWRAVDRVLPLLKPDHSVRVAFLPEGEDPDSLIAAGGMPAMRSVLEASQPLSQVVFDHEVAEHRLDAPEGRAGLQAALDAQARRIEDRAVQDYYFRHFRDRLEETFPRRRQPAGEGRGWNGRRRENEPPPGPKPTGMGARRDADFVPSVLLAALLHHPALFDELDEHLGMIAFADPKLDALKRATLERLCSGPALDSEGVRLHLSQTGHAPALQRLLNQRLFTRAPFARADASEDGARDGCRHLWRQWATRRMREELKEASRALAAEPTEANLARFRALRLQAEREESGDGDMGYR